MISYSYFFLKKKTLTKERRIRPNLTSANEITCFLWQVVWLSHGMFKSSCDISVEYFPFDIQDCQMKWASWTYDGFSVRPCLILLV
jgi:hypothetical protein